MTVFEIPENTLPIWTMKTDVQCVSTFFSPDTLLGPSILRKPWVRGIATGTVFRRLVAKCLSQQYISEVEKENRATLSCPYDSVWQCHDALVEVQEQLQEGEVIFAFLDDVHTLCSPERVRNIYDLLGEKLFHIGKTRTWNRAGEVPDRMEELDPSVWSPARVSP